MPLKLRAPANSGGVTHAGVDYQPEEDGTIEVESQAIAHALRHHGFTPVDESGPPASPESMDRAQLVAEVMRRTLVIVDRMSTDDIRARLLAVDPTEMKLPSEEEAAGVKVNAEAVTPERLDTMNRVELFAYLRASGVVVVPPIRNADLRRIAHETLAGVSAKQAVGAASGSAEPAPTPTEPPSSGEAPSSEPPTEQAEPQVPLS